MCVDHHYHASFILKQSQVTIVGHVISMQKHDTKDVYFLDDGTGILEAHYRHADTNNEEVQYWKNVNELFEEDEKIRWVTFHNLLIKFLNYVVYTHMPTSLETSVALVNRNTLTLLTFDSSSTRRKLISTC